MVMRHDHNVVLHHEVQKIDQTLGVLPGCFFTKKGKLAEIKRCDGAVRRMCFSPPSPHTAMAVENQSMGLAALADAVRHHQSAILGGERKEKRILYQEKR